jgi:diguanylate cyclase (GGDEF)-like protein
VKVLVADDDPLMRLLLSRVLTDSGYEVSLATDGEEAWKLLQGENAPSLAILDWVMPGMDGIELCSRIRSRKDCPYVYTLLFTSKNKQTEMLKGLDAGADDYLTKPVQIAELQARLRVGKRIIELQRQLLEAYESTQFQASHDSLTSMWNRSAILRLLEAQLAKTVREKRDVTVLLIDIDHFKTVNDTYGHLQGDSVLREIAHRMSSALRSYDLLGRYGGEEFLVIVPDCTIQDAATVGERVRQAIADTPIDVDGNPLTVTVSIGVAAGMKLSADTESQLLDAADKALYEAKRSGRNCVRTAEPLLAINAAGLSESAAQNLTLAMNLPDSSR